MRKGKRRTPVQKGEINGRKGFFVLKVRKKNDIKGKH